MSSVGRRKEEDKMVSKGIGKGEEREKGKGQGEEGEGKGGRSNRIGERRGKKAGGRERMGC